jgi:flagellar hook-length control protein FliK
MTATDGSAAANTAAATLAAAQPSAAAAIAAGASGLAAASGAAVAAGASTPANDEATTPAGGIAADTAGPAGDAAPKLVAAVVTPAAAASAQAAAVLANIGAADKHSRSAAEAASAVDTGGGNAAGAAQLSANSTPSIDAPATPTLNVAAGVETPEFGQGVANHVSWMVDNNLNGAKLQVNPPQLGPIEVRIAVQGDHAQVWLMSHSAVTRDALEASSPKLREMLGAQGFGQVSVDISQRSFQERPTHPQPYEWTPSANGSPAAAVPSTASPSLRLATGAVDAYA